MSYSTNCNVSVLSDPVLDIHHFNIASFCDSSRVFNIRFTQVEMMSSTFNIESDSSLVNCYIRVQASCSPWVKFSIRKYNVGSR
jgi:hypothetical protein